MSRLGGAAAGAAGGAMTAGLTTGWVAAAVLITTIAMTATSLCWILADHDRPHRLALLITAWRYGGTNDPSRTPIQRNGYQGVR
jgi:hypothetical protein